MNSLEVRRTFLDFFVDQGHREVRSSSLVPEADPTLLFTNAGMNQFKDIFLGREIRDYQRATTCQKCVRAGGKHNDLENVGRTARHHTFFEMLGNFSFGDYFKDDAIHFAWTLITQNYGLDPNRLIATVFREDTDSPEIWKRVAGIPDSRILRLGEKDNFWAMGDTGPCGPCSEILYDLGQSPAGHVDCPPDCECGRWLEIWNLVFMQYERDDNGALTPLPRPSIDTGMGLERIVAVMQQQYSNYHTDLFMPLIQSAAEMAEIRYGDDPGKDTSLRIIADHARSGAFLITDGVIPSNDGRGYVLRKILRRAIRHGKMLGLADPFLYRLTCQVAEDMGKVYPELRSADDYVTRVIRSEEDKFSSTLDFGLKKIDELVAGQAATSVSLSGADMFKLYDTYGFPMDLLQDIAEEKGWTLDFSGFESELRLQKERARAGWKGEAQQAISEVYRQLSDLGRVTFIGYEQLHLNQTAVLAILRDDVLVSCLSAGETGEIVLQETPFYAESGGQLGDRGYLRGDGVTAEVLQTTMPVSGTVLHRVEVRFGQLRTGQVLRAEVDKTRRFFTACNHTATHLLHAALREVLGSHVKQAGSLVGPDRLRFDFSHFTALTSREIEMIEELIQEQIWHNSSVNTEEMPVEQAIQSGAMALFGEKYQERVRVVSIPGFSRELCGGTHLPATGHIGSLKIISESSIASGVRRIEGVTAREAWLRSTRNERVFDDVRKSWKIEPSDIISHLEGMKDQNRQLQKDVDRLRMKLAAKTMDDLSHQAVTIDGIQVAGGVLTDVDRTALRGLADQLRNRLGDAVVALGAEIDGKAALVVMVADSLAKRYPAGKIVGALAAKVGGSGGGRPNMAEAGGKDPSALPQAMAELTTIIRNGFV